MRGFSRGRPGTIAAAYQRTIKRGGSNAWAEAAILDKLKSEHDGGLTWLPDDPHAPPRAAELLSVAFGRTVTVEEAKQFGSKLVEAARAVSSYWCAADDMPRMCGATDERFSFFWTVDDICLCPLEGLCSTQDRDMKARKSKGTSSS